jgi:hypothetical protein
MKRKWRKMRSEAQVKVKKHKKCLSPRTPNKNSPLWRGIFCVLFLLSNIKMRLSKDQTVDQLLTNSRNKIPTFNRALSFPTRGSLILDGTTVYYGNGLAWVPIGGGSAVTISGGPAAITTTPQIQPPPDNEYSYNGGSYYFTTIDNIDNQLHTLEVTVNLTTTGQHIPGQDALFVFPATSVPYNGSARIVQGICSPPTIATQAMAGSNATFNANGSFVLSCVQLEPSTVYSATLSFTWVI